MLSGDPDLYVWGPAGDRSMRWVSDGDGSSEAVSFTAPVNGVYQVEVYGYRHSAYQLSVSHGAAAQAAGLRVRVAHLPLVAGGAVEILPDVRPATREAISDTLRRSEPVDVLHYIGHGRFEGGEGKLALDRGDGSWRSPRSASWPRPWPRPRCAWPCSPPARARWSARRGAGPALVRHQHGGW